MKSITWAGFCQSSEVNAGPCRLFSEKSCDSGVVVQSHRLILVGKFITTWSQGSGSYKVNHQEGVVTLDLISTRTFSSCKSLEIGENLIWSSILKDRDGVNVGLGLLIWTSLALLFFTQLTKPWTEMNERSLQLWEEPQEFRIVQTSTINTLLLQYELESHALKYKPQSTRLNNTTLTTSKVEHKQH